MEMVERQKLLDGLDRRLALGEIDLATYNNLTARFSGAQSAPTTLPVAIPTPAKAVALTCPGCMAPLPPPPNAAATSVTCEFCGGSFAIQRATAEMEELQAGIKKWLSEMAGQGAGAAVDETSRSFIFKSKLLPSLRMAADRATEAFAFGRHQALFSFPLIDFLPNSPFQQALSCAPDLAMMVEKIKTTIARVKSPDIHVFAIGDAAKRNLESLELQCQETIYLANARRSLSRYDDDGFQKATTNLGAVESLFTRGGGGDPARPQFSRFASAMSARTKAVMEAVTLYRDMTRDSDGIMVDNIVSRLNGIAERCEAAAKDIDASGCEPKDAVPAAEGARTDAQTMRILARCVQLFGYCGAETGESFPQFLEVVKALAAQVRDGKSDILWLDGFLAQLIGHLQAAGGEQVGKVVSDFNWVDASAASDVKSSFFGGTETFKIEHRVLAPFWVGRVCFAQQSGIIFRKGAAAESLVLFEAGRRNGDCFVLPVADPLIAQIQDAAKHNRTLAVSATAVVPTVTREVAAKSVSARLASMPEFAGGYADLQYVVYLPTAVVRYSAKKGDRSLVLTPCQSARLRSFALNHTKIGSKNIAFIT